MVVGLVRANLQKELCDPEEVDTALREQSNTSMIDSSWVQTHAGRLRSRLQRHSRSVTCSDTTSALALASCIKKPFRTLLDHEEIMPQRPVYQGMMLDQPNNMMRYLASTSEFIAGVHGVGWWTNSGSIRGFGIEMELPVVLKERDVVAFALDGANAKLHIFHNRSYVHSIPIDTSVPYVPAVTITAECRIEVGYHGRDTLGYVDGYLQERAARERRLRLRGAYPSEALPSKVQTHRKSTRKVSRGASRSIRNVRRASTTPNTAAFIGNEVSSEEEEEETNEDESDCDDSERILF
jgi:hypothetical protein